MKPCKVTLVIAALAVFAGLVAAGIAFAAKPPKADTALTALIGAQTVKLEEALKSIDAAAKAVEAGEKAAATVELIKARALVAATHKALAEHAEAPVVANVRCPMMGTTIDPAKVPAHLTRTFNGRKIGFCCGGCPMAWDKLTDAQKDAKLTGAMPEK